MDGFYCARRRKLPFAAQGKGKKTVVYRISVICGKSDHYTDCHRAFLQGDPDSLPAQYRKWVVLCFGRSPWRTFLENWAVIYLMVLFLGGVMELLKNSAAGMTFFLDPGGHCGAYSVGRHMVSRTQKTVWKPAFSGDISASGACDGDYGVLGQWESAA